MLLIRLSGMSDSTDEKISSNYYFYSGAKMLSKKTQINHPME